jgi:DNA-binding NarL/FixJ family response regulator
VTLKTLICDDHVLVSEGLEMMLSMVEDIELAGVVRTGEEAVEKVQSGEQIDIVLMDVNLGQGINGIEATRQIKAIAPQTRVLVLTMFTDPATVTEAVKAGADGYLSKGSDRDAVERAIREVIEGRSVLDPSVTRGVFGRIGDKDPSALSEREMDVLQEVAQGSSTKEVAERLFLSEETVKTHLKQIFKKLDVRDRTEAVAEAFRRGLVH